MDLVGPLFSSHADCSPAPPPVFEIVTADPEFFPAPVIPVDPAAFVGAEVIPVPHLGALFPDPLSIAALSVGLDGDGGSGGSKNCEGECHR